MSNEFKEFYSTVTQDRGLWYTDEAAALFPTLKEVPSARLANQDSEKSQEDDADAKVSDDAKTSKTTTKKDSE